MYDILILGGGPAGISAALTARRRGKNCAFICGEPEDIPLSRSPAIDNYPGLPGVSGRELLALFWQQALEAGAERIAGHANAVAELGGTFGVSTGSVFHECRALILCPGVHRAAPLPGEEALLGRGVSYCATCDGMLYRGRRTAVLGFTADAPQEAEMLRSIGCEAELFDDRRAVYTIEGTERVTALTVNGERHPCEAVFILRPSAAPDALLPGLPMDGAHIRVERDMSTALPGVFAAGDCTGTPYQIAKAVGEGCTAALSAAAWLDR